MRNRIFLKQLFCSINCNFYNSRMRIRRVYMIIWSIKLVYRANVLATKKHHIRPTLEGRIPIGSFGTPKTFRVNIWHSLTRKKRLNTKFLV